MIMGSLSLTILLLLFIIVVGWVTVTAFRFLLGALFPAPKRPEYNLYAEREAEFLNSLAIEIQEFQVRNPGKEFPVLKRILDLCINHTAFNPPK
jgi:hypothetical protein